MKKLPKIYHIDNKKVNTNKEMCVVEEVNEINNYDIEKTLQKVYAGLGEEYNTNVIIETKNNVYNTSLIYKDKNLLITKENVLIKVENIKKITIKK